MRQTDNAGYYTVSLAEVETALQIAKRNSENMYMWLQPMIFCDKKNNMQHTLSGAFQGMGKYTELTLLY